MKEKLQAYKRPIRIVLWTLAVIAVVLYLLSHVPITKSLRYNMRGFIVRADGEILEEFDFTITGKDYNFIIDPPGGEISLGGNELAVLERDAIVLYFDWGSSSIAKKGISGHFTDYVHPTDTQILGALNYFDPSSNSYELDSGMFDSEKGNFCIYSDVLADSAFIVGVSDPDTDPMTVIDGYLDLVHIPELED